MKKLSLVTLLQICIATVSFAQEFPGYGTVSNEEINLKQCEFDKDANTVMLLHEAFSGYDDERRLITLHHVRIKILKEKGFAEANVTIPFFKKDDFENIDLVEGMTINTLQNNQVENTKLERKSIYTKAINERIGEVVFAFPSIKVGSIIDYKYRSTMKTYGGLQDWDFQEQMPVMVSKYTLIISPNLEFTYRVNKAPDMPVKVTQDASSGTVYFEMHNIPGLGAEPYMDARKDYLQKIEFQLSGFNQNGQGKSNYMTTWDGVTKELTTSAEFGAQLNKNIEGTSVFIQQVKAMVTPEEKMKMVFNFVRSNLKWNNLYSKYAYEGVKAAWQKKSGSSGDINLLLINLLKEAGLDAYPMLVSERFHGKVNSAYPFIDQFNSVFACVIINNKKYYLDATDKDTPPHITPFSILNTTAFIVNRKTGGLTNITNDTLLYKENIIAQLELAENGTLSGEVQIASFDYARIKKLEEYKEDKNRFLRDHFTVYETSISTPDVEVKNIENDSLALEQKGKISGGLNSTGGYSFLPLNLFTGFDGNPFLSDNRFSNINFGYRRNVQLNMSVQLPSNYQVDEIPKSVKLSNPDKDIIFIRQVEYDKESNRLICMMLFEFKKSLYEADTYPILKEVYKRIFDYLKEPVVLKKKG